MTLPHILENAKHLFGSFVSFILALSAFLGALYAIYSMGGRSVLCWLKKRLFEDVNNMFAEIMNHQHEFRHKLEQINNELCFVSVSQRVISERNEVMWWRSGEDGYTTEVGGYTIKYLQVPEKELIGLNWVSRIPVNEHPVILAEFERALKTKSNFNITYTFKKGDGSNVKINAHATYANKHWFGVLEPVA